MPWFSLLQVLLLCPTELPGARSLLPPQRCIVGACGLCLEGEGLKKSLYNLYTPVGTKLEVVKNVPPTITGLRNKIVVWVFRLFLNK